MKSKFYVLLLTVLFAAVANSQPCVPGSYQTFTNNTPVTIPAAGANTITSTINVSGAPTFLYDVNLTTFIVHSFNSDLDVSITSPAGTVVTLTTDNGSSFDNVFNGTVWNDNIDPAGQVPPNTANNNFARGRLYVNNVLASPLVPEEPLGAFIGENPNGTWTITVADQFNLDGGTLTSWSLAISGLNAAPTTAVTTVTNNTPVIIPVAGANVVTSTINIAGAGTQLLKATTSTSIVHSFNSDLFVTLTSPAGTVVSLTLGNGSSFDNIFDGTLWDDDANPGGTVPYTNNNGVVNDHLFVNNVLASPLTPQEALAAFAGENPNGTWTLTISDAFNLDGGSLNSWTLNLTTSSCIPPPCILTCPANITVSNDPNQCGAVVNYPAPGFSGTCGTITASPASGSFFPVGTTTVNVTSTLGGGNCSFTITVNDTQPPSITCPSNISVNAAAGLCSAVVTFAPGTASDNCPGVTVTSSPASGSTFSVGTTTVTQTATDAAGNTATCSFTVTVNDAQPPTVVCPSNITVNNTANQCGAIVTFAVGSSDNCSFQTISQSSSNAITLGNSVACNNGVGHTENSYWRAYQLSSASPVTVSSVIFGIDDADAPGGTQPVNVRIHTSAGAFPGGVRTQVASQTFNIPNQSGTLFTAALTTPPTVPGNSILVLEINTPDGRPDGNFFFIGSNTAAETAPSYLSAADCGITTPTTTAAIGFPGMRIVLNAVISGPVTVVSSPASGSFFPAGVTTTVTSTATDPSGNTATCSFTVRVNDTQAPTVTCPANVTRATDAGVCTATFTPNTPTAADNCAVTEQTWALTGATTGASPATGINTIGSRAFNIGVTTVTYTVKDAAGNTATCSFTITITDALLPVISTPPVNRTVCAGATATFSVVSSNAVTYQWQQFIAGVWTNITGANAASFSVPNTVQSMNTNTFRVNVVGLCTTVPSAAVTLFVNPLPTISLTSSNPAVLLPGQTTSIVANVNPTGGTFAWFKNGQPRTPTVTTGTLSNLGVDDAGTYHAVYTDLNGCIATSASIVISAEASDLFFVAPNPNFGQFWVRYYNQLNEPLTVIVYDSKGAKVHEQTSATTLPYTQINVNMKVKSGGIYLVELRGADGRRLGAKRIIVGAQ